MTSKVIYPPVLVVDDLKSDRDKLTSALKAALPREVDVRAFPGPDAAQRHLVDAIARGDLLPVALVADLDMPDYWGKPFLENQVQTLLDRAGRSLWTVLVSRHDQHKMGKATDAVPSYWIRKTEPNWAGACGEMIGALYATALASDSDLNDLQPTRPTPAYDRIYLYEKGKAMRSSTDRRDPGFRHNFPLGLVQPLHVQLRQSQQPIVMHRGHYVEVPGSMQRLIRVLLRWRTVARARQSAFWFCELVSFSDTGDCLSSPSTDGIPNAGTIHNMIGRFRRLKPLVRFLQGINGSDLQDALPVFPRGASDWNLPSRVFENRVFAEGRLRSPGTVNPKWFREPGLAIPCPPEYTQGGDPDSGGLFSRIQFVLTPEEVDNYNRWKSIWLGEIPRWREMPDAI